MYEADAQHKIGKEGESQPSQSHRVTSPLFAAGRSIQDEPPHEQSYAPGAMKDGRSKG